MGILDISFPEPSNLVERAKEHSDTMGLLTGAAGAGIGASAVAGTPLAAVVVPLLAQNYIEAATDDVLSKTEQSLQEVKKSRSGSMVRVCDGICRLIDPLVQNDEELDPNKTLPQAAREDPEQLQRVLERLLTDETKRDELQRVEQTLAALFAGEEPPDEAPINGNDPEAIVGTLKHVFDVESDREALHLYTLYAEFLGDVTDEMASADEADTEFTEALDRVEQRLGRVEQWTSEVVDTLTLLTLQNQAFTQLTALDFERQDPFRSKPPRYLWLTGYNFAELAARHGARNEPYYFDRRLPDDHRIAASEGVGSHSFSTAVVDRLQSGSNIMLTGPPASGKSHICKRVAAEWYSNGLGEVFYRESAAEKPFRQDAELERAIENAEAENDGQTLVVVEDAVADHANLIFDVMDTFRRRLDSDVCFLLDSRRSQWTEYAGDTQPQNDPPPYVKIAHDEGSTDFLDVVQVPPITERDCREAIETFNRTTNGYYGPPEREGDQLYDTVADGRSSQGQMLVLSDELLTNSQYAENTDGFAGDAPVRDSAGDLHARWLNALDHGGDEPPLGYRVAIAVSTLTAADIEVSPSHLYALASDRREIKSIADILAGSADLPVEIRGTLLIPDEAAPGGFTTRHTQWAAEFLASQLDAEAAAGDTVHETFVRTVSKIAHLADDSQLRGDIGRWLSRTGREDPFLQRLNDDPQQPIERLLRAVVSIGRHQDGQLAGLLQDTFLAGCLTDRENVPDVCSPIFRFELELQRGWILRQVTTERRLQDDPEQLFEAIIDDAAEALTPPERDWIRARATAARAEIAKDRLRYPDAIERFETAIEHYESINQTSQAASTYRRLANLGRTTEKLQWASVRERYDRAIELFEADDERPEVLRTATARATTAITLESLGWEDVLTHQQQALELFEGGQPDPNHVYWYRRTLREHSRVARESSALQWDSVLTRYERAIESYATANYPLVVARLKEELATAAAERPDADIDQVRTLYEESVDAYRSHDLHRQVARVYRSLATANHDHETADWETTSTYYDRALSQYKTAGADDAVIEVLQERANAAHEVPDTPWPRIESYYSDAIEACESRDAPTEAAKSVRAFAEAAATAAPDLQTVDARYQAAIDRFESLGDRTQAARLAKRRAEVAAERTDVEWTDVERMYQAAIEHAESLEMGFEGARIRRSLAREAKRRELHWTTIEGYFEQAAAAFEANDVPGKAAMTYRWLALAAVRSPDVDWETAQRHFDESTARFEAIEDSFEAAQNYRQLAEAALETESKQWEQIEGLYKQAIDLYEATGHRDRTVAAYRELGNAACETTDGSVDEAEENYQAAHREAQALSRDESRQQIRVALDATEGFIETGAESHSVRSFDRAVGLWCETWLAAGSRQDVSDLRDMAARIADILPTASDRARACNKGELATVWCDRLTETIEADRDAQLYDSIVAVCDSTDGGSNE